MPRTALNLRVIVVRVAVAVAATATLPTFATDCSGRIDQALQDLQAAVPTMDRLQQAEARGILKELCEGPRATTAEAEDNSAEDDGSESLLGIEFNRADPDAKGYSRLKKTH